MTSLELAEIGGGLSFMTERQMGEVKKRMTTPAVAGAAPCSAWYPLFEHMSKNHGLTLLDDELNTIAFMADESRLYANQRLKRTTESANHGWLRRGC